MHLMSISIGRSSHDAQKSFTFECPQFKPATAVWRVELPAMFYYGLGSNLDNGGWFRLKSDDVRDALYRTRLHRLQHPSSLYCDLRISGSKRIYSEADDKALFELREDFSYVSLQIAHGIEWLHVLQKLCQDNHTINASHVYLCWGQVIT